MFTSVVQCATHIHSFIKNKSTNKIIKFDNNENLCTFFYWKSHFFLLTWSLSIKKLMQEEACRCTALKRRWWICFVTTGQWNNTVHMLWRGNETENQKNQDAEIKCYKVRRTYGSHTWQHKWSFDLYISGKTARTGCTQLLVCVCGRSDEDSVCHRARACACVMSQAYVNECMATFLTSSPFREA